MSIFYTRKPLDKFFFILMLDDEFVILMSGCVGDISALHCTTLFSMRVYVAGAKALEEEFVIPSRPLHMRRTMTTASPSCCILVSLAVALFFFWKALSTA